MDGIGILLQTQSVSLHCIISLLLERKEYSIVDE